MLPPRELCGLAELTSDNEQFAINTVQVSLATDHLS